MREINDRAVLQVKEKALAIRRHIVTMLSAAGSGHTGGSLSASDIVACLYFWEMNLDPANPDWENRDRFVLSKGHAAPVIYAALSERGLLPTEQLMTLRKLGSPLQGHPDMRKLAGVEASTGSLGQGISWAVGMALAGKIDKKPHRLYVMVGDGELEECMVVEASMAAAHYILDNLLLFVDHNGLQIDGKISEELSPEPISDKFRAFGWHVIEVDGHHIPDIMEALNQARRVKGQPVVIVAATTKGKGCSFMEDRVEWHGTAPNREEMDKALAELV